MFSATQIQSFCHQPSTDCSTPSVDCSTPSVLSLPDDVLRIVLSHLDNITHHHASFVCTQWNAVIYSIPLWQTMTLEKHGRATTNYLEAYVEMGLMTWRQAFSYAHLARFLATHRSMVQPPIKEILANNPLHRGERAMPQPFCQNECWYFLIHDSTSVLVVSKVTTKHFVLKGEEGELLHYLACDGDTLFALRGDGKIVEWNYYTKEQVRIIETFSQDTNDDIRGLATENWQHDKICYLCREFHVVQKQLIFSFYLSTRYNDETYFQIISYASSKIEVESFALSSSAVPGVISRVFDIKDRQVYLHRARCLIIFDLTTREVKLMQRSSIFHQPVIYEQYIFHLLMSPSITVQDLETGEQIKQLSTPDDPLQLCIQGNFLLGFFNQSVALWNLSDYTHVASFSYRSCLRDSDQDLFSKLVSIMEHPTEQVMVSSSPALKKKSKKSKHERCILS